MIPDLRAYVVFALATTGGAPKDALDKAWDSRDKLSDEGLALAGLALDAAGDGRAHEAATLLEKKAHASDIDAHWEGSYDGLLEYLGRHFAGDDGVCAEAADPARSLERAAAQGGGVAGRASRGRLLVFDQADGDGDPGADGLRGVERRAGEQLRR